MALSQKSRQKPAIDIPLFNKAKRRRMDSLENVSPQTAPMIKKMKNAQGDYRTVLEPVSIKARLAHSIPVDDIVPPDEERSMGPKVNVQAWPNQAATAAQVLPVHDMKEEAQRGEPLAPSLPTPPNQEPEAAQQQASDSAEPLAKAMDTNLATARQIIEAQFSLEILMKHDELRFIEQELAKCQVALEQLRRCQVIPYPGFSGPSEEVSSGVGPPLQPRAGYSVPQQPAPWGVTDGPYTRHYAQWLLPDKTFDAYPKHFSQQSTMSSGWMDFNSGRATRASDGDLSRSRTSRVSTASKHALLSQDPSSPTTYRDPLVLKRSTDGKWVKLYCDKCQKENFANVQGFINHYRIAHKHGFLTHDAAAIACGRPIEVDESYDVPIVKETAAKPAVPSADGPFVHPFINNPPRVDATQVQRILDQLSRYQDPSATKARNVPQTPASSRAFVGSDKTPYLSNLLAKRSFSGDLEQAVGEASTKIDLDAIESVSDDEAETPRGDAPQPAKSKRGKMASATHTVHSGRQNDSVGPHHYGQQSPSLLHRQNAPYSSLNRPASRKGAGMHLSHLPTQAQSHKAYSSPYTGHAVSPYTHNPGFQHASRGAQHQEIPESPTTEMDLSPNTAESNPGLVSDREDDPEEEDEEAEHAGAERDVDVEMMDVEIEDASDVEGRKGFEREHEAGCSRKA